MKITEISYRALRTGRGYNNTSVEGRAVLEEDDTPEQALQELKFWVERQIEAGLKIDDAYADLANVQARVGYAEKEAERYEKRANEARQFIKDCRELAAIAREHGKAGMALSLENLL